MLAYHIERRGNPLYEPRRPGAVFDHNGKRIEKRQKERADALRERGLLPFPDAQKRSG